ncbi:unnamed protein product [Psylliodes chrysocephalus]|uniref:Uncharacterized protein n=1 Tax=Psylliodes chrysocephalus TaxID=3402493 RepID=A0A9P0GC23_9CUCU|nr:unnamed protein product [Psylliodes chrysocephala]
MADHKCPHDENRKKVCAPCGKKITCGTKKLEYFLINERHLNLVKKFVNPDYNLCDSKFPVSICDTCRRTLNDYDKNNSTRPLPKMPNYEDLLLPKATRTTQDTCNCYICLTGRFKAHTKIITGRGAMRNFETVIDSSNGLNGASRIDKLPCKMKSDQEKSIMNVCKICFQEFGRGKVHPCGSASVVRDNFQNLIISKLPQKQQEQVASHIINQKIESAGATTRTNATLELSTSGSKSRITINPASSSQVTFSSETLDNFQDNIGASQKQMKQVTNLLRSSAGKKSVPVYFSKHTSERSKLLEEIYHNSMLEFDIEGSKAKEQRPVIWANASELLDAVVEKRIIIGNVVVKIMADGGQGFFKICMTVLPEDYFCENYEVSEKKRKLYAEGGSVGVKPKLCSVNRLLMMCTVPNIKESYDNCKLKINDISFKFVCDFKLLLIINGQQTATSSHPCPFCFVSLKTLRNCQQLDTIERTSECNDQNSDSEIDDSDQPLRLKTYGDLKKDYKMFLSAGNAKKFAKHYHSTINPPLFIENDDRLVIEKCVIPELHILQGFTNHLFWKGLVPLLGREKALVWALKVQVISKNYHGEVFEGNACRKLLKNADKLNDQDIYGHVGYFKILPFIQAFKEMNKLVDCCFSTGPVYSDIEPRVNELRRAFLATGISETLKIHVLTRHLTDCLEFLSGFGLGDWSEQAGESVHHEFLKFCIDIR